MLIIPAIDIRNGKCVRLSQGNFNQETIYSDDPVKMAKQWKRQGAEMLHVVDLDGAKNGSLANLKIIKKITEQVSIPIQVGGGIRNKESVEALLSIGASRVILGTVALDNEEELKNILKRYASQVAVALDTKDGKLMKQGWIENSEKSIIATALELEELGVQRFIYTDIIKDGMLDEPNYKEIATVLKNILAPVIIGGGISTIDSIKKIRSLGVMEVVIGKALYEGKINLKEALNVS